jgi:serine/threonine protein kinase
MECPSQRSLNIVEQFGYGAAGLVSKGRYQGQKVAVKQIHREILREKHIMDEFKREVGIMATI